MSHITDTKHLATVVSRIRRRAEDAAVAWMAEDEDAYTVGRTGEGRSSNTASNPTADVAGRPRYFGSRDRRGRLLMKALELLDEAVADRDESDPSRVRAIRPDGSMCRCCDTVTATHGLDGQGRPTTCWACWRYLAKNGYPCDPELHKGRPEEPRMCECDAACCEPGTCPDRAAEGRTKSERCRKRQQRAS